MARHMLKRIVQSLTVHQWLLYGNSNVKSAADTLFFREDTTMKDEFEFLTISLNRNDRLRFILVQDHIVATLETVRQTWNHGVEEVKDDRPHCYELVLKGNPWWTSGVKAVEARLVILKIMEKLSQFGYSVLTGFDISPRSNDKSLFLFQRGTPVQAKFMCLSLHDIGKEIINSWLLGIQEEICVSDIVSYEATLNGYPWNSIWSEGIYVRALLLKLLNAFTSMGWRLACTADVDAMYESNDNGAGFPIDVHNDFRMLHNKFNGNFQRISFRHDLNVEIVNMYQSPGVSIIEFKKLS
ncbi:uncharacterized protein LOC130612452 isoform X2 [Hydractinia symbiolongicarpus]|nr:uncharacterized protein LOC130612452 isoform X2 [Hydractinia symbiolongicarpus]